MNDDQTPEKIPAGWKKVFGAEHFSSLAGPFYFREGEACGVGFLAEPRHANISGVVHGGALLTLADMALWDILRRQVGPFRGVTVTLNSEFLGPGRIGDFLVATGEPTRIGGRLMFARGRIVGSDGPVMSFSGTLKRLREA